MRILLAALAPLLVAGCVSGLVFSGLALLFARMVVDEIRYAETSMGLGVPRWWFTVFSPLLCAAIALRCFGAAGHHYMEKYGADADLFAKVAVKTRNHAAANPPMPKACCERKCRRL